MLHHVPQAHKEIIEHTDTKNSTVPCYHTTRILTLNIIAQPKAGTPSSVLEACRRRHLTEWSPTPHQKSAPVMRPLTTLKRVIGTLSGT